MHTQEPQIGNAEPTDVMLPAPTAWPFTLALGLALIFAGMLTNVSISILGAVLYLSGAVGWFREVLPHEHHVRVPAEPEAETGTVPAREVMRLPVSRHVQGACLPLKIYPVSAGVKGVLAGGLAIEVLATLYGDVFVHSPLY